MITIDFAKSIDQGYYIMTIKIAQREYLELTEKQAQIYLKDLIAKSIKMVVMEHYSDIQRMVDREIFNEHTKKSIQDTIQGVIQKTIEEHVKNMFDEK